jgi:1-deoxy-D-xylulose-5-phosphate synthase
MDRAGYVGGDGSPMHGFMDIAMYRTFPNAVLLAPCDGPTMLGCLRFMADYNDGPTFARYPRDNVADKPIQPDAPPFELGKANLIRPAKSKRPNLALLAYGVMVYYADKAIATLADEGYDIALYDARFAKPIDEQLLTELIDADTPILTVEDHGLAGGYGAAVLETCNDLRLSTERVHRLAMPAKWVHQDSRAGQLADNGLDAAGIARRIRQIVDGRATATAPKIHVAVNRARVG